MLITDRNTLLRCIRYALRPIVRFCLKHSLKIQDLVECIKIELMDAAHEEIARCDTKITQSRLSILTGLRRREVERLSIGHTKLAEPSNLIAKVLGRWQDERAYTTSKDEPRVLSFEGDDSQFHTLVRRVSSDLNPSTVLFELERVGAIERTRNGVRMTRANYIPAGNALAGFEILSQDMGDLISTVEHNVLKPSDPPWHHLRTEYDKIRVSALESLRSWFLREGHSFHLRAREELAKHDQDVNPSSKHTGPTVRVSFTSFHAIADALHKDKPEEKKS